jgi:hypothetical protein
LRLDKGNKVEVKYSTADIGGCLRKKMLSDLFSPTARKQRVARLRFGNPSFFVCTSLACIVLSSYVHPYLRWSPRDPLLVLPFWMALLFAVLGFVIHVRRWRSLSAGQRIGVLLLFIIALTWAIPTLETVIPGGER